MNMLLTILQVFLLFCAIQGTNLRFGSFRGVPYFFNYTEGEDWCNPSFECDIMSYICRDLGGGKDCELTVFDTLDERLTALEKNSVDIVVSRFSISPEREKRIDFVRPYYYSSGAKIFSLPEDEDLFNSFEDLISQPVCMDLGFYAAQVLQQEYGLFMLPSTQMTLLKLLQEGYCVATITHSDFLLDGLVQTDIPPQHQAPYAVAVSKNPKIQYLLQKLHNVLLEMIYPINGEEMSYLQKLEQKYIVEEGLKENVDLAKLVGAIIANNGKYIGEQNEDEIWNAADLTNVSRFSDELLFIDPVYDSDCKEALDDIYQSYKNGTQIGDLPIVVMDSVMYTGIFGVEDPTDWINSWRVLQHPFVKVGSTALELAQKNPQFLVTTESYQDAYLSDENNFLEGQEHYFISPFDTSTITEGDDLVRSIVLSPTRVVRTFLSKNIQPKNNYSDMLIIATCAIGEIRNW